MQGCFLRGCGNERAAFTQGAPTRLTLAGEIARSVTASGESVQPGGQGTAMPVEAHNLVPALEELSRSRQGVVTRAQLAAAGVPHRTITSRCRAGVWQRPLPGVIVLHSGPLTWQQRYRTALAYAGGRRHPVTDVPGEDALLTGVAALALYRLRAAPPPEHVSEVDVLVPQRCGVRSRGGVAVRRTMRMPQAVLVEGRLPAVPLRRAVVDAVRGGGRHGVSVSGALYEVVQTRRVTPERLVGELKAAKLSGRSDVAAVLRDVCEGLRSPAEGLARAVVLRSGLPRPLWNARLTVDGEFLAVPDAYWPGHGVILEVDSQQHHWAVEEWEATMARHNRLAALGFRVLHVSPRQLRDCPDEIVAALRSALSTGPHGPVDRARVTG